MRFLFACALVLLAAVSCAAEEEKTVIPLDANNFQLEISSKDIVLVCFYHSQGEPEDALDPEFVAAAEKMKGQGVVFGSVDCAYEKTLLKKYEIEDFPSLRLFRFVV
jgi:protein disulfide-isomerase A1